MKSQVRFISDLTFKAQMRTHEVTLDTASLGGKDLGASPKELLLSSILACSGMDVVSLLKKHKVPFDRFEMKAEANAREHHPRIFESIEVIYELSGKSLDSEKIVESVRLSMTKYCGVSAMVAKTSPLFYTLVLNGEIEIREQAVFEI